MGLAFLGIVAVAAYPFALEGALARYGVRAVAGFLLATGVVGLAWRWRAHAAPVLRATQIGILALLAGAAALGTKHPLLYVPAVIQLGLAATFAASLREEHSIVERMAHLMQPYLPDWIRPYCRVVTALWSIFFLGNAVAITALAATGALEAWRTWTGLGLYAVAMVLQGVETVFRKSWFRAFDEGPVDRVFRRIFPPQRTDRGRRSMEYIRKMRIELGMEEP